MGSTKQYKLEPRPLLENIYDFDNIDIFIGDGKTLVPFVDIGGRQNSSWQIHSLQKTRTEGNQISRIRSTRKDPTLFEIIEQRIQPRENQWNGANRMQCGNQY